MGKAKTATMAPKKTTARKQAQAKPEAAKVMVVTPRPTAAGICSTCRHEPRCLFARAARQPIQHCEEFDDGGSKAKAAPATKPVAKSGGIKYGQGQAEGICVNCDTRLTCMHREPGKTVLECEDYS